MSAVPTLRFKEFTNQRELRELGDLFPQIRNGFVGTATPYYTEKGVPYLQGKNIKSGKVDDAGLIYVNQEFHDWQKKSQLKTNDVLMVQSGHVGECAVVPEIYVGGNCHALVVLSPDEDVHSQYFVEYFHAYAGKRQIHRITTGNTIQHILTSDLKPLPVPTPSLPEQKKIADFLGALDDKIAGLHERERLLTQYKKGVMQKIFVQTLRFKADDGSEFPDWQTIKFEDALHSLPTRNYQIQSNQYKSEGRYPVIDQGKELIAGYSDDESKLYVNESVIVFGDHTTVLKYIDFDFIVGADGTKVLQTEKYNLKYLYYYLLLNNVEQEGYKRHFSILRQIKIIVPTLMEQQKIADFLSAIDSKITAVSAQITQMQDFKKGLLQQMFV